MCVIDVYFLSADIKEHVKQIEKAVSGKEPRFVLRALRALPSTSRRLNPNVLHKAISGFYTSNAAGKEFLLSFLEEVTDTHKHTHTADIGLKLERGIWYSISKCSIMVGVYKHASGLRWTLYQSVGRIKHRMRVYVGVCVFEC